MIPLNLSRHYHQKSLLQSEINSSHVIGGHNAFAFDLSKWQQIFVWLKMKMKKKKEKQMGQVAMAFGSTHIFVKKKFLN